jgi:threonylcarbamoyladenosine tRNA methylthiotransferase MtaB
VLTGVDLTSYGPDLPGTMTLGRLVRQILRHVPELKRLRLSSIDQVEVDADLLAAIAEEARLMPHLHLSLQSGDDMILKRMKRRHAAADAVRFCQEARRLRPDMVFGADLITGFPTESDAMFENTRRLVDACELTYLHVFPFSPRPGTPAARMPQLPKSVARVRAGELRAHGARQLDRYLDAQFDRTIEVLMEKGGIGRTPQFAEVEVAAADAAGIAPSTLINVRIIGRRGSRLTGEPVAGRAA